MFENKRNLYIYLIFLAILFSFLFIFPKIDENKYTDEEQNKDYQTCLIDNPRYVCDKINKQINTLKKQKDIIKKYNKDVEKINELWEKL